jgi:hypothetical protein
MISIADPARPPTCFFVEMWVAFCPSHLTESPLIGYERDFVHRHVIEFVTWAGGLAREPQECGHELFRCGPASTASAVADAVYSDGFWVQILRRSRRRLFHWVSDDGSGVVHGFAECVREGGVAFGAGVHVDLCRVRGGVPHPGHQLGQGGAVLGGQDLGAEP